MPTMTAHGALNACRCFQCRVRRAAWERGRMRAVKEGRPYTVTGEHSAEKIGQFLKAGYTYTAIGRPAGMDGRVLRRIVENPGDPMLRSTHDRLALLKTSDIEPGRVRSVGAMRRLRDLSVQGWQVGRIADEAGLHTNTVRSVVLHKVTVINGTTEKQVKDVFTKLSRMDPPTDFKAQAWARKSVRRGWKRLAAYANPDGQRLLEWETP